MKKAFQASGLILLSCIILSSFTPSSEYYGPTNPLWQPVQDEVYLQEVGQKIPLGKPATSLALFNNHCYVVVEGIIHMLLGSTIHPVMSAPVEVKRLK